MLCASRERRTRQWPPLGRQFLPARRQFASGATTVRLLRYSATTAPVRDQARFRNIQADGIGLLRQSHPSWLWNSASNEARLEEITRENGLQPFPGLREAW